MTYNRLVNSASALKVELVEKYSESKYALTLELLKLSLRESIIVKSVFTKLLTN